MQFLRQKSLFATPWFLIVLRTEKFGVKNGQAGGSTVMEWNSLPHVHVQQEKSVSTGNSTLEGVNQHFGLIIWCLGKTRG